MKNLQSLKDSAKIMAKFHLGEFVLLIKAVFRVNLG